MVWVLRSKVCYEFLFPDGKRWLQMLEPQEWWLGAAGDEFKEGSPLTVVKVLHE